MGALLRELVAVKGAVCLDEGADREINLRAAFNGALDVRDLLTRTYEPAALPPGLSLAVAELLREIEKAQIVTAAPSRAEPATQGQQREHEPARVGVALRRAAAATAVGGRRRATRVTAAAAAARLSRAAGARLDGAAGLRRGLDAARVRGGGRGGAGAADGRVGGAPARRGRAARGREQG